MIRRPLRRPMTGAGALVTFLLFSLLAAVPARAEQDAPAEGDGERIEPAHASAPFPAASTIGRSSRSAQRLKPSVKNPSTATGISAPTCR